MSFSSEIKEELSKVNNLKDKKMLVNKNHKFMAIIPAHNEEFVIRNLVESLKEQDYPKTKTNCSQ